MSRTSLGHRVFVIMEAAGTHDGNFDMAVDLVHHAADIGTDAVKFQYVGNPKKLAQRRFAESYLAHYRTLQLQEAWFPKLSQLARQLGIEFMCTAYLADDLVFLSEYVSRFKISGFEARDKQFVRSHYPYGKQIIISCSMGWTEDTLPDDVWDQDVKLLHCVSAYPTPIDELNLDCIRGDSHEQFGGFDGFSDHSADPQTGAVAVGAGAKIIEFHARHWDTKPENPDYAVSLSPTDARRYVKGVRFAETAMGNGCSKQVQISEEPYVRYQVRPDKA